MYSIFKISLCLCLFCSYCLYLYTYQSNVMKIKASSSFIISSFYLLCSYSPNGIEPPPRWTCFLCALGLFIYQSLDSIDGKQARRTNTSSPLGELFDHGCDSISTIFVALSACISCQLGHYPNWLFFQVSTLIKHLSFYQIHVYIIVSLLQCFCAIALFYCAHWQTYVSGTMRFGKIDVTEAQFSIIAIHMVSAILGPEIWLTKVSFICSIYFGNSRRNSHIF